MFLSKSGTKLTDLKHREFFLYIMKYFVNYFKKNFTP